MDIQRIQRIFLFSGLIIVAYLMLLAWNEDYGQKPNPTADALDQVISERNQSSTGSGLELSVEAANEVAADEFDTPESATTETLNSAKPDTATSASLIQVTTDTLSLYIDPRGGRFVEVALLNYPESLNGERSLRILENNLSRLYVAESSLIGSNGPDAVNNGGPALYQAEQSHYVLGEGEDSLVVNLRHTTPAGVEISKRFTFQRNAYLIDVTYHIDNRSAEAWAANFSAKIVRDSSPDPSAGNSFGLQSFLGAVLSTPEQNYEKYDFDDLVEKPIRTSAEGGWVAFIQHYFLSAWIPPAEQVATYQSKVRDGRYLVGFVSPETRVAPGEQGETGARFYVGPKIIERLESIAPHLDLTVDYGILWFLAYPLFLLMDWIHDLVGNWGVSIIAITVLVKLLFFRLSAASYRSMANMRRVTPELQRIRDTYGNDRQRMSQAMMDLYRKEKINPLGGCFPILIQMPVFIALYWVLLESVQLRQAPFMLWIDDLSVQDPYFILPLLMGVTMFIQMSLNPAPPDPMQARVMKMMPIIFTVFFLFFPAGLVLYWFVNNLLSIAQQWVITRQIERDASSA